MRIETNNSVIYIDDNSEIALKIKGGDEYEVVNNQFVFSGKNKMKDLEKRIKALESK